MKIGITGHTNIEKCFKKETNNTNIYEEETFNNVFMEIENYILKYIKEHKLEKITFVSGMARGVDEIFALIAIKNNFNLIICVPKSLEWYKNKTISSGEKIQAINFDYILNYDNLIKIRESKYNLEKGNYGYFLSRNQDIVDESDIMFSYKKYESTGTNDCIERAIKENKYKGNI